MSAIDLRHVMLTLRSPDSTSVKIQWVVKWSHVANPPSRTESGVIFEYFEKGFGRKRKTLVQKEIKLREATADKVVEILAEQYDEFHTSSSSSGSSSRSRLGSEYGSKSSMSGSFSSRNSPRF